MNKYNPGLIYDVGMNNGDDTAYYLRRGFRVVAIEPNPALMATAYERFRREIEAGELTILNVGVAAADGELPFWVCLTDSRLSSFDRRDASLDDRRPVEEIRVPCRTFRSILDEFGVPFYLKVDIQGNEFSDSSTAFARTTVGCFRRAARGRSAMSCAAVGSAPKNCTRPRGNFCGCGRKRRKRCHGH